jgi:hypothetical protein
MSRLRLSNHLEVRGGTPRESEVEWWNVVSRSVPATWFLDAGCSEIGGLIANQACFASTYCEPGQHLSLSSGPLGPTTCLKDPSDHWLCLEIACLCHGL